MVRIYSSNGTFKILNLASSGGGDVTSVNGQTGDVVVDLQSATDEGNETTNDLVITDATKGLVLKDGSTQKRMILTDDGAGNYQPDLENYP